MKRRHISLVFALLFYFGTFGTLASQPQFLGELLVDSIRLDVSADTLSTSMVIDVSGVHLDATEQLLLQPALLVGKKLVNLPALRVMGRRSYLSARRSEIHRGQQLVEFREGQEQRVDYAAAIRHPYSRDTLRFLLDVEREGCRCATKQREQYELAVHLPPPALFQPRLLYVTPAPVSDKIRLERGSAYLQFRKGSWKIQSKFRDNKSELSKIERRIIEVMSDDDIRLAHIKITGYASPEGNFSENRKLAQRRMNALVSYLARKYRLDPNRFIMGLGTEDWSSLRDYVVRGNPAEKDEVLQLIDSTLAPDAKERLLRQRYPRVYMDLQKICFPKLRRTDYEIGYSLRRFSPREAARMVFERPQRLSLEEMYGAASTFVEGSDAYCEVFEVAVRMFPADSIARLNAANAALRRGDVATARRHLSHAGQGAAVTLARGALAYLEADYAEAARLWEQAREEGAVEEARYNLRLLGDSNRYPR